MCLILFAYRARPDYELVLLANRDEFYQRPTDTAHFWEEAGHVLAGRDLRAGGTWMGVTRAGRWAALTNYREGFAERTGTRSRGELVADYLLGSGPPETYLQAVAARSEAYNGFNLLTGDPDGVFYFSNREGVVRRLEPGVYGLSNHLLDTPWFKVEQGKEALRQALSEGSLDAETLLGALDNDIKAPAGRLPDTGIGAEWETVLSPMFIRTPEYGTRSSTALLIGRGGQAAMVERTFEPGSVPVTRSFSFEVEPVWAG